MSRPWRPLGPLSSYGESENRAPGLRARLRLARATENRGMESNGRAAAAVFAVVVFAVAGVAAASYLVPPSGGGSAQQGSSTTTPPLQGVVTGYVTASPSQPVCTAGQSCDVNMTGYSLVFTLQCAGSSGCESSAASLSQSGHYSALLPAGTYTVTLGPSCPWLGCSAVFPTDVTVVGGNQLVQDFQIDTGIR